MCSLPPLCNGLEAVAGHYIQEAEANQSVGGAAGFLK